jgi:hypothetical protein
MGHRSYKTTVLKGNEVGSALILWLLPNMGRRGFA